MTVGALPSPMTFMERGVFAPLDTGKRPSFAYLGPVEWDRSGDYTYGFWMQVRARRRQAGRRYSPHPEP